MTKIAMMSTAIDINNKDKWVISTANMDVARDLRQTDI